jgi:lysophospholipase L1-like esterase
MKPVPAYITACIFIGLAGLATHESAASQLVDNLLAGKNQTVVVYGTSLTAASGAVNGWVKSLDTWLDTLDPDAKAKATIINSGQSGRASRTGLKYLQTTVIDKKPDAIFIEWAINDASTYSNPADIDFGITIEESKANLKQMIADIKAALPDVEIIIQTMNPAWDSPGGSGISATVRPHLADYYQGYRDVYAELKSTVAGLIFIDHNINWLTLRADNEPLFQKYVSDGVHPTAEGSNAVTFPAIKAALQAPSTVPVPEPAMMATLLGVGAAAGCVLFRRARGCEGRENEVT